MFISPQTIIVFLAGLAVGSFANVCIARLPINQSIALPSSKCLHCHHQLKWWQNIPLIGFIILSGRCYFCNKQISWRYPAIEFGMSILYSFSWFYFSGNIMMVTLAFFLIFEFLTISIIDYKHSIIPDELSFSLIIIGILYSSWNPYLQGSLFTPIPTSVLSTLLGGLIMLGIAWLGEKLFHKEALGGGDIKLVAGIGACLGITGLYGTLLLGSLAGVIAGSILMALRRKKRNDTIPFGPFLCFGATISFLYPNLIKKLIFP